VKKNSNAFSAFTLVELAIVIVIIGLLVGGVLAGQELIKQAKWRSAMKEIEGYKGAMATFFGKYDCLPGDCAQGFRFFGASCGTDVIIASSPASARNGCNGNGDKVITTAEGQLSWKHLSFGKMIKGSFTSPYVGLVATNVNIPSSAIADNVGTSIFFSQGNPSTTTACGFQYCAGEMNVRGGMLGKNVFNMGNTNQSSEFSRGAFMTPIDMFEFDVKFDDGLYYSGAISGFNGGLSATEWGTCVDHNNRVYANNNVTHQNKPGCRIVFDTGF
jgi:Tfp pilus assembly major pilin PilA